MLRIQNDLFDLGADVATPGEVDGALRIVASQVERLEREIDAMNAELAPLTSFILPSGSPASPRCTSPAAVVRRAERAAVALNEAEPLNPQLLAYLNRLSDHLFVAARIVAASEGGDVLWQPGAHPTYRSSSPKAQSGADDVLARQFRQRNGSASWHSARLPSIARSSAAAASRRRPTR